MYPLKVVLPVVALDPLEVELGPRGEEDHLEEEVDPLEVEEEMEEKVDSLEVEDIRKKVDHLEVEDHPNQAIPPPKVVVALSEGHGWDPLGTHGTHHGIQYMPQLPPITFLLGNPYLTQFTL
jgi:hypothetical protein